MTLVTGTQPMLPVNTSMLRTMIQHRTGSKILMNNAKKFSAFMIGELAGLGINYNPNTAKGKLKSVKQMVSDFTNVFALDTSICLLDGGKMSQKDRLSAVQRLAREVNGLLGTNIQTERFPLDPGHPRTVQQLCSNIIDVTNKVMRVLSVDNKSMIEENTKSIKELKKTRDRLNTLLAPLSKGDRFGDRRHKGIEKLIETHAKSQGVLNTIDNIIESRGTELINRLNQYKEGRAWLGEHRDRLVAIDESYKPLLPKSNSDRGKTYEGNMIKETINAVNKGLMHTVKTCTRTLRLGDRFDADDLNASIKTLIESDELDDKRKLEVAKCGVSLRKLLSKTSDNRIDNVAGEFAIKYKTTIDESGTITGTPAFSKANNRLIMFTALAEANMLSANGLISILRRFGVGLDDDTIKKNIMNLSNVRYRNIAQTVSRVLHSYTDYINNDEYAIKYIPEPLRLMIRNKGDRGIDKIINKVNVKSLSMPVMNMLSNIENSDTSMEIWNNIINNELSTRDAFSMWLLRLCNTKNNFSGLEVTGIVDDIRPYYGGTSTGIPEVVPLPFNDSHGLVIHDMISTTYDSITKLKGKGDMFNTKLGSVISDTVIKGKITLKYINDHMRSFIAEFPLMFTDNYNIQPYDVSDMHKPTHMNDVFSRFLRLFSTSMASTMKMFAVVDAFTDTQQLKFIAGSMIARSMYGSIKYGEGAIEHIKHKSAYAVNVPKVDYSRKMVKYIKDNTRLSKGSVMGYITTLQIDMPTTIPNIQEYHLDTKDIVGIDLTDDLNKYINDISKCILDYIGDETVYMSTIKDVFVMPEDYDTAIKKPLDIMLVHYLDVAICAKYPKMGDIIDAVIALNCNALGVEKYKINLTDNVFYDTITDVIGNNEILKNMRAIDTMYSLFNIATVDTSNNYVRIKNKNPLKYKINVIYRMRLIRFLGDSNDRFRADGTMLEHMNDDIIFNADDSYVINNINKDIIKSLRTLYTDNDHQYSSTVMWYIMRLVNLIILVSNLSKLKGFGNTMISSIITYYISIFSQTIVNRLISFTGLKNKNIDVYMLMVVVDVLDPLCINLCNSLGLLVDSDPVHDRVIGFGPVRPDLSEYLKYLMHDKGDVTDEDYGRVMEASAHITNKSRLPILRDDYTYDCTSEQYKPQQQLTPITDEGITTKYNETYTATKQRGDVFKNVMGSKNLYMTMNEYVLTNTEKDQCKSFMNNKDRVNSISRIIKLYNAIVANIDKISPEIIIGQIEGDKVISTYNSNLVKCDDDDDDDDDDDGDDDKMFDAVSNERSDNITTLLNIVKYICIHIMHGITCTAGIMIKTSILKPLYDIICGIKLSEEHTQFGYLDISTLIMMVRYAYDMHIKAEYTIWDNIEIRQDHIPKTQEQKITTSMMLYEVYHNKNAYNYLHTLIYCKNNIDAINKLPYTKMHTRVNNMAVCRFNDLKAPHQSEYDDYMATLSIIHARSSAYTTLANDVLDAVMTTGKTFSDAINRFACMQYVPQTTLAYKLNGITFEHAVCVKGIKILNTLFETHVSKTTVTASEELKLKKVRTESVDALISTQIITRKLDTLTTDLSEIPYGTRIDLYNKYVKDGVRVLNDALASSNASEHVKENINTYNTKVVELFTV